MSICPICQFTHNRPTAKFCAHCGSTLPAASTCSVCGQPLRPDARFCHHCGATLKVSPPPAATSPVPRKIPSRLGALSPGAVAPPPAPAARPALPGASRPASMAGPPTGKLAPALGTSSYSLLVALVTLGSALSVAAVAALQLTSGDGISMAIGALNVLAALELLYLSQKIAGRDRGSYASLMAACKRDLGWMVMQGSGWNFLLEQGLVSQESLELTMIVLAVWAGFDLLTLALLYLGRAHFSALGAVETGDLTQPPRALVATLRANVDAGLITSTERDHLLETRAAFIRWLSRQKDVMLQALNQETNGLPVDVLAVKSDQALTPLVWLFRGAPRQPVASARGVLKEHRNAHVCIVAVTLPPQGEAEVDGVGRFGYKPALVLLRAGYKKVGASEAEALFDKFQRNRWRDKT